MKKLTPYTVLFLSATVLLTSCGEQLTLTKRHYTSGYYVDVVKKQSEPKAIASTAGAEKQAIPLSESKPMNIPVIAPETPGVDLQISNTTINKSMAKTKKIASVTRPVAAIASRSAVPQISMDAADNLSNTNTAEEHNNSGLALILIVIITIFIPPLGVALAYGIDIHFWIDLILTLLFFFPGLIYGLIVVLM